MSAAAEQTVLGAILVDNQAFASAIEVINHSDFASPANGTIFFCMSKLSESASPIDLVTLKNELVKIEKLQEVGGIGYIAGLVEGVPRLENVTAWAQIIKEASTLRRLAKVASSIGQWANDGTDASDEILDRAESAIFALSDSRKKAGLAPISDSIKEAFEGIEKLHESNGKIGGVTTGLIDVDRMLDGLHGGDLILLAARPAVGKTSLAMNIARYAAENGTVAVFSLEMSKKQLVQRMIYSEARINSSNVRLGRLVERDWNKIASAATKMYSLPISIDDTTFITPLEIRAKCRRLKAESGLSLVVIDYLQLLHSGAKRENANQEMGFISRSLKAMAKELDVPVLCLSQLSRGTERREDHRPQLADLRDSGCLEQDSDLVLFIYRDSIYSPTEENANSAELIVAKNRNGPVGIVPLSFAREFTRFDNMATSEY